jgi:hypothetical protein
MPRQYFRKFPLQNEATDADATNESVSSGATDEQPKGKAKPEEDDTVKRTLKKLREELAAAQNLAKEKDAQLKERERLDEEERAKRTGDYEILKKQTIESADAKVAAAEKREREALERVEATEKSKKNTLKRSELKTAFSRVFHEDIVEDLLANKKYLKLIDIVEDEDGDYEVIVFQSEKDQTQRFKSVDKKYVPFTLADLVEEIASKKPTAAKPVNRASGDNIANGNGNRRGNNDFNLTASANDLTAKALGF